MYLIKLKYFVFTEKNIDFITHVIIIIDLSFYSKLQLVIILLLYVFISVKHTRVKANSFMHTILSLTKHTNAKANAIFFNTKCNLKIPNYAFRNGYLITYIIDIIIRSFFKHLYIH